MSDLPDVLEVGQYARIRLQTVDDSGVSAVNPSAIALTITQPDGAPVNKTLADFTNVNVGTNDYYFHTAQFGLHTWHAVTTNPDDDIDGGFEVGASPESASDLVTPTYYQRVTADTTSSWAAVSRALADAVEIAEDHCNRRFAYGTYTERLYVYRDGKVYPTNTPLGSVTNPAVATSAIQGAGVYIGSFLPSPELVNVGDWNAAVPPQVDVTYLGGYQPERVTSGPTPPLPVTLKRALCRIAWLSLHPVVLQGVPAGAKSASVGDVSLTGDLSAFIAIDPSIARDLRPYKKRQAHAWQRA